MFENLGLALAATFVILQVIIQRSKTSHDKSLTLQSFRSLMPWESKKELRLYPQLCLGHGHPKAVMCMLLQNSPVL